jgi:hypothetical protein
VVALTDAEAIELRAAITEVADLNKIGEVSTLRVTTAAGVPVSGLTALPVKLKTDMERSPDADQQVEAIAILRRAVLPATLPRIDRTMKVTITHEGLSAGPYTVLRFAPQNSVASKYRMELRRTAGVTYG